MRGFWQQRTAAGRVNPGQLMVRQLAKKFLAQIEQDLQEFTPEWFDDHPELAAARSLGQEELLSIADLPGTFSTLNENLYDFLLGLVEERTSFGLDVAQLKQVLLKDSGEISSRLQRNSLLATLLGLGSRCDCYGSSFFPSCC